MHVAVGSTWTDNTGLVATGLSTTEPTTIAAGAMAAVLKLAIRMARVGEQVIVFWASPPSSPGFTPTNRILRPAGARFPRPVPPTSCAEPDPTTGTAASRCGSSENRCLIQSGGGHRDWSVPNPAKCSVDPMLTPSLARGILGSGRLGLYAA